MEWVYLIILFTVWLMSAAVGSVVIQQDAYSTFELKRRAYAGDEQAKKDMQRRAYLPDVMALRYVAETVLFVIFVALSLSFFGFIAGLLIVFAGLVLLPAAGRVSFINNAAQAKFDNHEPALARFSVKWHSVLGLLEPKKSSAEVRVHSKEEFLYLAHTADGVFSKDELSLLREGFAFQGKKVSDVMTPQSVIDYAQDNEVVGPIVLDRLHKTGHSRFPVIHGDINHVVGVLYTHDLVPLDRSQKTVQKAMSTDVFYIRADQTLEHALHAFLRTHHHLFIVVNEYRETVGLLSLEDVLEALLGRKIVDEFDAFHDLRAVAETNPRNNNQPKKHEDV